MADKKASKFDQTAYVNQYHKEHHMRIAVVLNKDGDSDIIEHLDKKPSKSGYIKQLIRKDMKSDDQ